MLLKNNELNHLITSLNNNVYRNVNVDQKNIELLALFCFKTVKKLNSYNEKDILSGNFDFPKYNYKYFCCIV